MGSRTKRRNLANVETELFLPPVFVKGSTRRQRFSAAVRRYFDLQAGSIWNDLKGELSTAAGTVLDVGCGAQPYRLLLPGHVRYIGIDTADAKERFGYEVSDTIYFSGDVWPIGTASVDLVLCAEVLEHVAEPGPFLAEIRRCLRPTGKVVVVVPFSARWHFIPHDYYRYTPAGLKHVLGAAGFGDITVHARGNPFTVACYKGMALLLPLLFAQRSTVLKRSMSLALGLLTLPFLVILAALANLSLAMDWGEDCLGYTVIARPAS
jgi:SAM-dependent methyltransferase